MSNRNLAILAALSFGLLLYSSFYGTGFIKEILLSLTKTPDGQSFLGESSKHASRPIQKRAISVENTTWRTDSGNVYFHDSRKNIRDVTRACKELVSSQGAEYLEGSMLNEYLNSGWRVVSQSTWNRPVLAYMYKDDGVTIETMPIVGTKYQINGECVGADYILEK